MKNIVNNSTPFFDNSGNILSLGRIAIVAPNTDDEYLNITNREGRPLQNPMFLSVGGFPMFDLYIEDGVSYDVQVYDSKGTLINTYYVENSDNKGSSPVSSITSVGNVEALRNVDTAEGKVLVLGYSSAGDYCPPRVFTWNVGSYEDNAGTIIKSQKNDSGAWILNESDVVDIRFFGVNPESESKESEISAFSRAVKYSKGKTLYFPKGNYYFDSNFDFSGCNIVMEKGCFFNATSNMEVLVKVPSLETRGGLFTEGARPVVSGTLKTSLYRGYTAPFLAEQSVLDGVTEIVFDYFKDSKTENSVTIADKTIVWEVEKKAFIKTPDCRVFNRVNGEYSVYKGNSFIKLNDSGVEITGTGGSTRIGIGEIFTAGNMTVQGKSTFKDSVFESIAIPFGSDFPDTKRKGSLFFQKINDTYSLQIFDGNKWLSLLSGRN